MLAREASKKIYDLNKKLKKENLSNFTTLLQRDFALFIVNQVAILLYKRAIKQLRRTH